MRSRFPITLVILLAAGSCVGPISDPPFGGDDDEGPTNGAPQDAGAAIHDDAGSQPGHEQDASNDTLDAGAGSSADAGVVPSTDAAATCPPPDAGADAAPDGAADGGDAGDAGLGPDGALRPAPPLMPDAGDAAVDAGVPDAADAGEGGLSEAGIPLQPCL